VIFEVVTTDLRMVIPLFTNLPMLSINVRFSNLAFEFERYIRLSSFELLKKFEFVTLAAIGIKSLLEP
jgi:hypothetical protein